MSTPVAAASHPTSSTRPAADLRMRRLLRIPEARPAKAESSTHTLFTIGMLISALRCLLTYIVLPILAPIVGAGGVGPTVTIPLGVVALYFDIRGIRRFWAADHRWRWYMTAIYGAVMAFVLALLVINIIEITR